MELKDQELVNRLVSEVPELKNLWSEHLKFEQRLEKLDNKLFLTPPDQQEKKKLQLAKLNGKRKIEQILERYR